jgi:hypothetical protein
MRRFKIQGLGIRSWFTFNENDLISDLKVKIENEFEVSDIDLVLESFQMPLISSCKDIIKQDEIIEIKKKRTAIGEEQGGIRKKMKMNDLATEMATQTEATEKPLVSKDPASSSDSFSSSPNSDSTSSESDDSQSDDDTSSGPEVQPIPPIVINKDSHSRDDTTSGSGDQKVAPTISIPGDLNRNKRKAVQKMLQTAPTHFLYPFDEDTEPEVLNLDGSRFKV